MKILINYMQVVYTCVPSLHCFLDVFPLTILRIRNRDRFKVTLTQGEHHTANVARSTFNSILPLGIIM